MKDFSKIKNYRTKYKRYYGIDFDGEFDVHHIDLNRENNDISNLLLLPKELHAKYHLIINALSVSPEKPKADGFIDMRLSSMAQTRYAALLFAQLPEVIAECNKWVVHKANNYMMFRGVDNGSF